MGWTRGFPFPEIGNEAKHIKGSAVTESANKKWVVDVKGKPGEPFEISVLRNDNGHGKKSYGWFDEDKLLISHSGTGSWSVNPLVFEKLVALAHEVADKLNEEKVKVSSD